MSSKNTDKTAALTNRKLGQLHPEMDNVLVVAMVLNKTEPNIFLAKNDTQYRGVMTFTLRDSKQHIVNCKYWASREKVEESNELVRLGDVVDVVCPKITFDNLKSESADHKQPRYQPVASLPISLVLNEGHGFIQKHSYHDLENYAEIKKLAHQSHKPLYSVMNLADVRSSFSDSKVQAFHTDFLVVVGLVRTPREIRATKDGRPRRCLELVVFDQSLSSGMTMTIWHADWIERARQFWQPMKTVLHLIDVKVSYSEFYKGCVLGFTSRSIIYENPLGQETQHLLQFAASIPKSPFDMFAQTSSDSLPKPEEIQTVMTIRQIYTRAEGQLRDKSSEQFTAVLCAMVTQFDVDRKTWVLNKKWQVELLYHKTCLTLSCSPLLRLYSKACNRLIAAEKTLCDTEKCQLTFSFGYTGEKYEYFFNMNVHFTDHTGTLTEARLTDAIAARVLGITCEKFLQLDDLEVDKLKWYFLLNHFEVKLMVKKSNMLRRKMVAIIIDMRHIDLDELAKNILVF